MRIDKISRKHRGPIRIAMRLLPHSEHKIPMVAVIANGRRIIGIGLNKNKSHPKSLNHHNRGDEIHSYSIHAEVDAILSCPKDLVSGSRIYVVRMLKSGELGLARPCKCCRKILEVFGIRKFIYSSNEKEFIEEEI